MTVSQILNVIVAGSSLLFCSVLSGHSASFTWEYISRWASVRYYAPAVLIYSTVPMVLPVHANSLLASLNSRNSLRRLGSGASGVPASEVVTPIFPIKQGVLYSSLHNAETSCWIDICHVRIQEIIVWWYLDGYTPLYYVYTRTFNRESYRNRMTCTGRIASSMYTTVSLSEPFSPRL